jgi:hypothetical protein
MNKFLILTAFFSVLVFSQTVSAQTNFKTYGNSRFGYSISYPSDLLVPQGEAENGDGQIFKNADAEMRVYGSNMLLNETLKKEYDALLRQQGKNVTYKASGTNFFAISGKRAGKIFYRKTIENAGGAFITFEIEYKEAKRATYDKVVTKVVKSFKA